MCTDTKSEVWYISYRIIVLKCSLELPQCHVGSGAAVIPLDVVFVYLQGLSGISQGVPVALCAQVCQAAVAVVDGIGWIDLQSLRVVLDCIFIVFFWKTNVKINIHCVVFSICQNEICQKDLHSLCCALWEKYITEITVCLRRRGSGGANLCKHYKATNAN